MKNVWRTSETSERSSEQKNEKTATMTLRKNRFQPEREAHKMEEEEEAEKIKMPTKMLVHRIKLSI